MPPPINPKVLEAVDAMCRGVGIDQAIQSYGLKDCENLRRNLRRHMQKRQAPVARSTSTSSTAVDVSSDAEVLCDFAAKAAAGQGHPGEAVHPRGQGSQDSLRLVRRAALRFFGQVGGGAQRMVRPAQGQRGTGNRATGRRRAAAV